MLTPEQLQIEPWIYERLQQVRDFLRSGNVVHVQYDVDDTNVENPDLVGFDMDVPTNGSSKCGTVCCIGGWVYVFAHGIRLVSSGEWLYNRRRADEFVSSFSPWNDKSQALTPLFYPSSGGCLCEYTSITTAMAADAIDSFLNTGDPNWPEITADLVTENEETDFFF